MPLVSERTPRWRNVIGMILLVAIFGIVLFVLRQGSSVQRAVNTSIDSSDRSDCRAAISATFAELRDRRDNLSASLQQQYARAQLDSFAGTRPQPETVDRYAMTEAALAAAILAVEQLPNLGKAVEHGWAPSKEARSVVPDLPRHVSPCPKVG